MGFADEVTCEGKGIVVEWDLKDMYRIIRSSAQQGIYAQKMATDHQEQLAV